MPLQQYANPNKYNTPTIFIRLRRRPRALPVDECVRGVGANPEPRYHCFDGFRHWRITLRSLGACVPKRFGAHGRRRVFFWRYHGLSPWGSIRISVGKKEVKNMTREPSLLSFEKESFEENVLVCYGTSG
jgi:hypothetical protein